MRNSIKRFTLGLLVAALPCAAAYADKPASPGNSGKQKAVATNPAGATGGNKHAESGPYFNDYRTGLIRDYFVEVQHSGNCPPGLAKKNNGCQPPGQAKQWQKGQRLPPDLVYYDLPSALLHELGRTPDGEKIVRVGTAVLLINAATGMILDTIEN